MAFCGLRRQTPKSRELLDGQREKFQQEFRQVELDLQAKPNVTFFAKRDVIAKGDYDKNGHSVSKAGRDCPKRYSI